jgi:hypothetical protein
MQYYGFEHRYGANMRDERGDVIGKLVVFSDWRARDAWLEEPGHAYLNNAGARTKMTAADARRFRKISAAIEYAE